MASPTIEQYNVTQVLNTTDGENMLVKILQYVSNPNPDRVQWFDYMPGMLIMITIFSIIFLSMKARGVSNAGTFFTASLINFIIAILLYPLRVISGLILTGSIMLFLGSVVWAWWESRI